MGVARIAGTAVGAGALVLLGTWVTGAVVTDDATTAMTLTGLWFVAMVGLALLTLRRWHRAALPVAAALVVTTAAVGSWLLLTSHVDRVVAEQVLAEPSAGPTAADSAASAPAVARVAAGAFRSGAHETRGTATLLRRADGDLVLTLVDFSTSAGPDLRVRLVPSGASGVDGGKDIGALKGNKGNQQYALPRDTPTGRVVIWCRAFSVVFGSADLRQ